MIGEEDATITFHSSADKTCRHGTLAHLLCEKCEREKEEIARVRGTLPLPPFIEKFEKPGFVDDLGFEQDPVDHPSHYSRWKMEPIEFIMVNDLPGWLANVIKYVMRYDAKDGLKDLYKARSYLDMKIRQLEGVPRFWEKPVAEERILNVGR